MHLAPCAPRPASAALQARGLVAWLLGMEPTRGRWRPPEPSARNSYVFRWGPLFEDCRGERATAGTIRPHLPVARKSTAHPAAEGSRAPA